MDLMYSRYAQAFGFDELLAKRPKIFYYRDEVSYQRQSPPKGSIAYYSPATKQLVAYEGAHPSATPFQVLCHEGSHQFFDLAFPGFYLSPDMPRWFSEGLAECFASNEVKANQIYAFGVTGPAAGWLPSLQTAIKDGRVTPIKTLVSMTHEQFDGDATLHYAQSWSLCHFLWSHPSLTPGDKGTCREVLVRLVDGFKRGRKRDEVYQAAFARGGKAMDLDALHKEWADYVLRFKTK